MLNSVLLTGNVIETPTIKELDDHKVCSFTLSVPNHFKNANGIFETNLFSVNIHNELTKALMEKCKKGDVIAVKGFLQENNNTISIRAEKISFLTSNLEHEKINDEKNIKI